MPKKNIIPFVDLARQFCSLEDEFITTFREIGRSGTYILGDRLESFEKAVADYCGVSYAIGVGDGSAALFLILKALGIGPGDEVITAPNSFIATAWVIVATGARPIFVDVAHDMNINPDLIEASITAKTKAIMPVHLTGRSADMNSINGIASRHGLYVVEDAAQAIGARYYGKRVGGLAHAAGFSLHPLKNLGVFGDGGFITTNDQSLANKLIKLRNHGLRNRDECEIWGYNSRLDPLQAAFAEIKLRHLDKWNQRSREIASMYRESLSDCCEVPRDKESDGPVYHNFVIRTSDRDQLIQHLATRGVSTAIHYPVPLHLQEAAIGLGYKKGAFPNAEKFSETMISLPIYPELTNQEVSWVIESVQSFYNKPLKSS